MHVDRFPKGNLSCLKVKNILVLQFSHPQQRTYIDQIRNPLAIQLIFGGFTFVFAGILLELIHPIHFFLKKVPYYIVSEVY